MRELFIKKAIEYNDFYSFLGRETQSFSEENFDKIFYFEQCKNVYTVYKEFLEKNECSSMREYFIQIDANHLAHFDITKMKNITLNTNNPFKFFYHFDNEILFTMFELLAKTHQGIKYFENYSAHFRDLKEQNRTLKDAKIRTLIKALEILNNFPNTDEAQKQLIYVLNSFGNRHFTMRQLFQNLLYEMFYLLKDNKFQDNNGKKTKFDKEKIIRIVNSIIREYFGYEDDFTKDTKIEKFKEVTYFYDNAKGITLHHL